MYSLMSKRVNSLPRSNASCFASSDACAQSWRRAVDQRRHRHRGHAGDVDQELADALGAAQVDVAPDEFDGLDDTPCGRCKRSFLVRTASIGMRGRDPEASARQTRTSFGAAAAGGIAGVHDAARLDQHDMALALGDRPVLDALRHDVHLARPELDGHRAARSSCGRR
jgi:hypothetical protein